MEQPFKHPNISNDRIANFLKLGWHLSDHGVDEMRVTFKGFKLIYDMVLNYASQDHVELVLYYSTKKQLDLHKETSFAVEKEEYRAGILQAAQKGCK